MFREHGGRAFCCISTEIELCIVNMEIELRFVTMEIELRFVNIEIELASWVWNYTIVP